MRSKLEARALHRLHHPGRIIHLRAIGSGDTAVLSLQPVVVSLSSRRAKERTDEIILVLDSCLRSLRDEHEILL